MEPSSNKRHSVAFKVLGLLVGLALGIAAIILVVQPSMLLSAWPQLQTRITLSGVRTVEGVIEKRAVYEYGLFGERQVALTHPGKLIDYDRTGKHEAILAFFEETRDVGVVVLGGEPRTLALSPLVKSSVSIAPDGSTVAYAELIRSDGGAAFANLDTFFDADRWVVKTVDIASGSVTTQGVGYAPQFFTYDGVSYLLFTNGIGIRIVSIGAENRTDLVHIFSTSGTRPAQIAEDGRYLALFDSTIGTYRIFRVTGLGERVSLEEQARHLGLHRVAFKGSHAVVAMPIYASGAAYYHLGALDLTSTKPPMPSVRFLTSTFPNKLIP